METAAATAFRPQLSGHTIEVETAAGPVAVHTAGSGPPLLLVHSINAAASAAEVRPLHEHYAATRTVFSLDLPGYGATVRPNRLYTPRLMTDALHGVVRHICSRFDHQAIDCLALSLSCEFLARAASEAPADYRSLALISPTGLSGSRQRRGPAGSTSALPRLHRVLQWLSPGLYGLLTHPAVVRFFLRKTWGGPKIDELMFAQAVATAGVSGAQHAPLCFLSGALFSRDILSVYERLNMPVWMCHGVRGDFTDYRQKTLLAQKPNWRMTVFPSGALPHFECLPEFCAALDPLLACPDSHRPESPSQPH